MQKWGVSYIMLKLVFAVTFSLVWIQHFFFFGEYVFCNMSFKVLSKAPDVCYLQEGLSLIWNYVHYIILVFIVFSIVYLTFHSPITRDTQPKKARTKPERSLVGGSSAGDAIISSETVAADPSAVFRVTSNGAASCAHKRRRKTVSR